jgi:hypothetical protein
MVKTLNPALLIKFKPVLKATHRTQVAIGVKAQPVDQRKRILVPMLLEIKLPGQDGWPSQRKSNISLLPERLPSALDLCDSYPPRFHLDHKPSAFRQVRLELGDSVRWRGSGALVIARGHENTPQIGLVKLHVTGHPLCGWRLR